MVGNSHRLSALAAVVAVTVALPVMVLAAPAGLPENLALKARATANSEYSPQYQARFACDGRIPPAGSQQDVNQAWCVKGQTHRQGAEFTLEWPAPVTVAEIIYYARTAWFAEEGWKDYEVWGEGAAQPVHRGQLAMGHGPQRITLPAAIQTKQLTLKFTSSYGGMNPGASEIQVFASRVPEAALGRFHPLPPGRPEMLPEEVVESPELKNQLTRGELGFERLVVIQRRELNPSHVYTYHVEDFGAGGGLYLFTPATGELRCLVESPQGQILDCDVSYDGRQILFSWRREQAAGYQVFVIHADGTGLRQLTEGPHHNYNACWLPDGGIAFLSTRASRFAYCWVSPVGILYRMEADGSQVRRLSANIVNDFTPSVMEDGRLIYSRWEYVDKPAIPIQSLWTIHPDGTGLAGFFGNRVLSPATFMEARSIPGTTRVLCTLTSHNGPARGAVGIINPALGNNAQAAIENLTPEVDIGRVDRGDGNHIRGPYENPFPLDDRYFLVSKRGTILVRDYAGTQQAVVLPPRGGLGFYSPMPLRPRPRPPVLMPLGEVRVTSEEYEALEWATVVLQNVHRGLEPHVHPREVTEICVVEEVHKPVRTDVAHRAFGFQFPVISCGATYAAKRVWGFASVSPDGSACFQVPARRPIYFMALDAQGRAVQRMRTFTHLMPGEIQGCVGCHEPRQQTTLAGHQPLRYAAPQPLRPPEWGQGVGFDYSTIVQPVLDRYCVACHSGNQPAGNLDLCGDKTDFFNVSYEVLARGRKRAGEAEWDNPYTSWIPTYNGMEQNILQITPKQWGSPASKLTGLLLSGHPGTNGQRRFTMDAASLRRIFMWMDLNVPYYGTSETAYPEKKGCRQIYPPDLDKTLAEVAVRRCATCHEGGRVPRQFWTRLQNPQRNPFLLAPLSADAGGWGKCGPGVFADTNDPDYQAILRTFDPVLELLQKRPRMDMPGARPAEVDRSCLGSVQ
jgi:hypothetical protein